RSSGSPNPAGTSTNQLIDNAPASPDAASELASHNTGSTAVTGTVTLIAGPINTPPIANPDDGGIAANGAIGNAIDRNSGEQTKVSKDTLTDGGSSASPTMLDRLKQVLHPVAAFAANLSFLHSSEPLTKPAITAEQPPKSVESTEASTTATSVATEPLTPMAGPDVSANLGTLKQGESAQITFQATVNSPPMVKSVSTQGNVTYTGGPGGGINTDDPEPGGASDPTVTNIDTSITWTGATSGDWNTATNWQVPGPAVSTYAPGVTNSVNDVV